MKAILSQSAAALKNAPVLWRAATERDDAASDAERIAAATNWLLEAQRASGGGGYAHSFHLLHGWQPPYPETTGYILPTLWEVQRRTGQSALGESIAAAARWLLAVQREDGSFPDLQGNPQVFDTGQILIGFNMLAQHVPAVADVDALRRAARWLCSVQEPNGSFVRHAYNGLPHAYYSRVGAALVVAGRLLGDEVVRDAGIANLRWTCAQQTDNDFFRHLSFNDEPPFLHTMVYVIEGLLDGAAETGDRTFFNSALRFASRLRAISETRDGVLRSQYLDDYSVANPERCLTGVAQWVGVACRLSSSTGDNGWTRQAQSALDFLKKQQILSRDRRLNGGLPGSAPLHGRYMRAAIPNWGVKFFLDAMMLSTPMDAPVEAQGR